MKSNRFFKNPLLYFLGILLVIAISTISCRTDFEYQASNGNLRFSKDTVYLDTIFTNISSSTYTLKVYNDSDNDIQIPLIRLKEDNSRFRVNVDGITGTSFENIPLLAKDSLFVFVEATLPDNELNALEFLLVDALQFYGGNEIQEVPLISLIKDATFLYPGTLSDGFSETLLLGIDSEGNEIRIDGFYLDDDELTFTNTKPYVIYGYAAVPQGKILNIEPGARVHFHKNSGLIVENGASLQVNGQLSDDSELLENEVIFEGDRLEPDFSDVAGQWGTVWFFPGSSGNSLENLTIKNATIGLFCEGLEDVDTTAFDLKRVQVHNSSVSNLWVRTASLYAENSVFGNAGQTSVYLNLGGSYDFKHCTIANYWTSGFRTAPALLLDNYIEIEGSTTLSSDLKMASFGNCIIDGNSSVEFLATKIDENQFNFEFQNCSLQFNDSNSELSENTLYDFTDVIKYKNVVLNINTAFTNPYNSIFTLEENSDVIGIGNTTISLSIPLDILGNPRTESSNLGAYHFIND